MLIIIDLIFRWLVIEKESDIFTIESFLTVTTFTYLKQKESTGWNDKIVVLKKTTLHLYFKTFIEKINSGNLIM